MKKIILGIDPGIADTGYGIIEVEANHKLKCLDYGTIKTEAKESLSFRLGELNKKLDAIIKEYQPDLAAVEQLFFCANVKTALTVGQARGVILLSLIQNQVPIKEFTPLQVKQAVSTYGKASKLQVQKMVMMILGLEEIPKPDDAADALAAAICAVNFLK